MSWRTGAQEAAKRLEERKKQEERAKQEKEARKASLLGWGDSLPELQLNRALAVLSKQYRYDGTVKTRRAGMSTVWAKISV
ncbi:MAG: hypothetical protein ACLVJZ_03660 [[Clostridium] leptum]